MDLEFVAEGMQAACRDVEAATWGGPVVSARVEECFTPEQVAAGYSYQALCTIEVKYRHAAPFERGPGESTWSALYGVLPDGSVTLWAN